MTSRENQELGLAHEWSGVWIRPSALITFWKSVIRCIVHLFHSPGKGQFSLFYLFSSSKETQIVFLRLDQHSLGLRHLIWNRQVAIFLWNSRSIPTQTRLNLLLSKYPVLIAAFGSCGQNCESCSLFLSYDRCIPRNLVGPLTCFKPNGFSFLSAQVPSLRQELFLKSSKICNPFSADDGQNR